MNNLISIQPLYDPFAGTYDAVLAAAGFETRARFAFEKLNLRGSVCSTACGFATRSVHAFDENKKWFESAGFELQTVAEAAVEDWTAKWVRNVVERSETQDSIRLCVDISSMSRLRLASFLSAVMQNQSRHTFVIDFVYSIASWSPCFDESAPIERAGPVLPFFGGWSGRWDNPTIAVVGLGYEPDKAVGAYEFLEAAGVWTFIPVSSELKYSNDVQQANKSLLVRVPINQNIVYRVDQPVSLFGALESVVFGLMSSSRPVILPFGPKIFALCSLLVACLHREVPVWRISSGQYGEPIDRLPSGQLVLVRVVIGRLEKQKK